MAQVSVQQAVPPGPQNPRMQLLPVAVRLHANALYGSCVLLQHDGVLERLQHHSGVVVGS